MTASSQETGSVRAHFVFLRGREGGRGPPSAPRPVRSRPGEDGRLVSTRSAPIALLLATLAGCDRTAGGAPPHPAVRDDAGDPVPSAVRDDAGGAVSPAAPVQRIVSLVPSLTEVLLALGAGDRIAGRTEFDDDPRLVGVPSVGAAVPPSLEAIAALSPDLVVGWMLPGEEEAWRRLAALGIPVYRAEVETVADVRRHVGRFGRLLGLETEAAALSRRIGASLDSVASRVAGRARPSVLYVVWPDPPQTAGPGTYLDSLIAVAGGRNVFGDVAARWPTVSLEEVVRRRPDVLVIGSSTRDALPGGGGPLAGLRASPGWRELEAVRAGRVLVVPSDLFDRPGPRVGEAARRLAAFLHP
ncbi:MAG: ABC transporter substrate-binding protein, partial [Gemmatimonadota bacterium]